MTVVILQLIVKENDEASLLRQHHQGRISMKKIVICIIACSLMSLLAACGEESFDKEIGIMTDNINDLQIVPDISQESTPPSASVPATLSPDADDVLTDTDNDPVPTDIIPINAEDEAAARKAAMDYYNGTTFSGNISSLAHIEEQARYEDYVPDDASETIIAFEVIVSENYSFPRIIILMKNTDNGWDVVNEGY